MAILQDTEIGNALSLENVDGQNRVDVTTLNDEAIRIFADQDASFILETMGTNGGAAVEVKADLQVNNDVVDNNNNTIWSSANEWVPQAVLENDSITIDGISTPLGGSVVITDSLTLSSRIVSSNVSTASDDFYIGVDTNQGSFTVTLSSADVENGRVLVVYDNGGNASANNITVDTEGTETISGTNFGSGLSSIDLITDNESVTLKSDGTNWFVV